MVVESETGVIGYITGNIILPESFRIQIKMGIIDSLFIEEQYRGQGLGSKLISFFENWCIDKGIHRTRIVASFKNQKGIKLYKRLGYEECDLTLEKII